METADRFPGVEEEVRSLREELRTLRARMILLEERILWLEELEGLGWRPAEAAGAEAVP